MSAGHDFGATLHIRSEAIQKAFAQVCQVDDVGNVVDVDQPCGVAQRALKGRQDALLAAGGQQGVETTPLVSLEPGQVRNSPSVLPLGRQLGGVADNGLDSLDKAQQVCLK